jgi:hypothetical protein
MAAAAAAPPWASLGPDSFSFSFLSVSVAVSLSFSLRYNSVSVSVSYVGRSVLESVGSSVRPLRGFYL